MSAEFEEAREMLKEDLAIQNQQANMPRKHSGIPAAHAERTERVGRHPEVPATIADDPIRKQADQKRQ